jgi:sugar phosphate isomerase/epimerase
LCLDTGHALVCKVDSAAFIRTAGARLKALHVADNLGTDDHHMLPYGRGKVNWPAILEALRDTGYAGLFNFEVPGENRCPVPIRLAKLDYALALAGHMIASAGVSPGGGASPC